MTVAQGLADWLQSRTPPAHCPWTVFQKNLVQKVLEDHHLPARLAQYMPEDKVSGIQDAVEEILGLHPPSWNLVRQMSESVLQLAELGNVILVGRGANLITAHLPQAFHVRLVGSREQRIRRVMEYHKIGQKAATTFVGKEDAGRRRYIRKYFGKDIDDPLLYTLLLNTDALTYDQATEIIGHAVMNRCYAKLP
jgi:hypothetical protein